MNRKFHWGIVALIVILIAAGGFIYWQVSSVQQLKEQLAEEAKEHEQNDEPIADNQPQLAADDQPQPTTGQSKTQDVPRGEGQIPAREPQTVRRPFSEMPLAERLKAIKDWHRQSGLEPPPEGYRYVWLDVGIPRRDENGAPILLKEGEPFFEVITCIGFAPTREEYAEYQQMEKDRLAALFRGDTAEANRLLAARKRFREAHRGELPSVFISGGTPGVDYSEQSNKILFAAYRDAGFDYLIPDGYY